MRERDEAASNVHSEPQTLQIGRPQPSMLNQLCLSLHKQNKQHIYLCMSFHSLSSIFTRVIAQTKKLAQENKSLSEVFNVIIDSKSIVHF